MEESMKIPIMILFREDGSVRAWTWALIGTCVMLTIGFLSTQDKIKDEAAAAIRNNPDSGFLYTQNTLHVVLVTCAKAKTDNEYVTAVNSRQWYNSDPIFEAMNKCMKDAGINFVYTKTNKAVDDAVLLLTEKGCLNPDADNLIVSDWFKSNSIIEDHMLCVINSGVKPVLGPTLQ